MGKGGVGKEGAPAPAAAATGGRGGDKENQRRNGRGGGAAATTTTTRAAEDEKKKAHKCAKTEESSHPPSQPSAAAAAATSSSSSTTTTSSVRYPRSDYSDAIPPSDRTFLSPDITDADKLLYLATRVMEADTLSVEKILLSTKYNHLSQEMGKYAKIVEKRLGAALVRDAKEENEEVETLKNLKQQREEEGRVCEGLEDEVGRLRKELAKWEGMEREVQAEGEEEGGMQKKVVAARKEEEGREEAAMTEAAAAAAAPPPTTTSKGKRKSSSSQQQQQQQRPFPSPVMEETNALLSQGPAVRQKVLSTATQLLEALEQQLPTWEEKEEEGREKQKELAAAFAAGAFAGLPAVGAPKEAAKKMVGGGGGKRK